MATSTALPSPRMPARPRVRSGGAAEGDAPEATVLPPAISFRWEKSTVKVSCSAADLLRHRAVGLFSCEYQTRASPVVMAAPSPPSAAPAPRGSFGRGRRAEQTPRAGEGAFKCGQEPLTPPARRQTPG